MVNFSQKKLLLYSTFALVANFWEVGIKSYPPKPYTMKALEYVCHRAKGKVPQHTPYTLFKSDFFVPLVKFYVLQRSRVNVPLLC